ncbi:MAG: hypothetical protein ACRDP7_36210, partial [Trebonia sp.]
AGSARLLGRVGTQKSETVAAINDYYLQLSNTGTWSVVRNSTSGKLTTPGQDRPVRQPVRHSVRPTSGR